MLSSVLKMCVFCSFISVGLGIEPKTVPSTQKLLGLKNH
jgi:hypothetical protein